MQIELINSQKKQMEKVILFNDFCSSKNCKEYIEWDFGYGKCESCKLVGQSHDIVQYPENCVFLSEIKNYELRNR